MEALIYCNDDDLSLYPPLFDTRKDTRNDNAAPTRNRGIDTIAAHIQYPNGEDRLSCPDPHNLLEQDSTIPATDLDRPELHKEGIYGKTPDVYRSSVAPSTSEREDIPAPVRDVSYQGYSKVQYQQRSGIQTGLVATDFAVGFGLPAETTIQAAQQVVDSTPDIHPNRAGYFNNLGNSVFATTMPLNTMYPSTGIMGYIQPAQLSSTPPFNAQENYGEITSDGTTVVPNIEANIEKGFFFTSDRVWTCYGRNYFAVNVSCNLTPWFSGGRLYLTQRGGKGPEQIHSIAVSLAAAHDSAGGKNIELIQHNLKRNRRTQLPMKEELLLPTLPRETTHEHSNYRLSNFDQSRQITSLSLPLQTGPEYSQQQYSLASHSNSNYQYAFEHMQFKSATRKNGKRRAHQQYYHLIVELWANIQSGRDIEPRWVKIAARSSHPVVVRGCSPVTTRTRAPIIKMLHWAPVAAV